MGGSGVLHLLLVVVACSIHFVQTDAREAALQVQWRPVGHRKEGLLAGHCARDGGETGQLGRVSIRSLHAHARHRAFRIPSPCRFVVPGCLTQDCAM